MTIISFYSYKGGVGRTFVALETAAQLARRGHKVCVWDLDLEAPTLHKHAQLITTVEQADLGTLELFAGADSQGVVSPDLVDRALVRCTVGAEQSFWLLLPGSERLLNIDAEDASGPTVEQTSYAERYCAIDWQRQFDGGRGVNLFLSVADELARRFDVVIIDARTGLTDLGLLSTRVLADAVVLVFGLSDQNLEGVRRAYAAITQRAGAEPITPVCLVSNLVPDEVARSSNPRLSDSYRRQRDRLSSLGLFPDVELPLVPTRLVDDLVPSLIGGQIEESKPFVPLVNWIEDLPARLAPESARTRPVAQRFEREVATLLRHAGWDIVSERPRAAAQVDLLLQRTDSFGTQRAIVECKLRLRSGLEEIAQLESFREAWRASEGSNTDAFLVTSVATRAAREAASAKGLTILTPVDLVREVLGFPPEVGHGRDPAGLRGNTGWFELDATQAGAPRTQPLTEHFEQWLGNDGSTLMVLEGPPGSGKSSSLAFLAWALRQRWHEADNPADPRRMRWPILVNLRDMAGRQVTPNDLLEQALVGPEQSLTSVEALRDLYELGHVVLLLDGLDETQNPNAFLDLIRELTRGQGKLIVATRPRRLSTEHLPRSSARVTIQPLSDEQVERLARLRYGTGAERLLDDLHSSPELARLVRTPLLAQIVLDNHAALNSRPGLSPGVLIDEITSSWLAASNIGDREREIWRILLRDIAWSQWESSREEFSSNELASAWLRLSDPDTPAAEALDVASQCPLLVRGRAGKFRFAHRLFAEFFLAEGLRDAVAQHSAWRLQVSRLTEGVIAFLHGFEVSVGDIQWLANLLTEGSLPSVPGASENALLILRALAPDRSIEGADLSGDDLSGLNLDGVSLPRANLRGALLTGTSLKGANLESADLSGADLRGATLSKARISAARLGDADLLGADLSGADLSQTGLEPDDSRG